ncbi:homoserine kinase [Neolewinella lacunae]|uniref:Homoserine kinase n=1 Tax=Neolewinella lacunae TaxID=1517758 RepID=A0A923PLX1_9BACT|nr:homoserine kinase [Neolewinella lacunae]MBC6995834.1 homoserine kinase [Neolewinella lacunae]MDN3636473.1 homoserine kinase [Neolewinella lacunae]
MQEVRVFAPATVANVAVGFDILGFAINRPGDEIVARFNPDHPGLVITAITGTGDKVLPYAVEENTAGVAAQRLLEHLGQTELGIDLEIHKRMPFGSGLGSSAASAAGAVVAVNELLGAPLSRESLLYFAVLGEEVADGSFHADNVAPCLVGGITLIRSNDSLDIHHLPVPGNLQVAVVHPDIEILTRDARAVLSDQVSLKTAILQMGSLASFITALYTNDLPLLGRSLHDYIVEPQRKQLIKGFDEVKQVALQRGALGCSISGAGPSVFALCDSGYLAQAAGQAMQEAFARHGVSSQLYVSPINQEGVVIL